MDGAFWIALAGIVAAVAGTLGGGYFQARWSGNAAREKRAEDRTDEAVRRHREVFNKEANVIRESRTVVASFMARVSRVARFYPPKHVPIGVSDGLEQAMEQVDAVSFRATEAARSLVGQGSPLDEALSACDEAFTSVMRHMAAQRETDEVDLDDLAPVFDAVTNAGARVLEELRKVSEEWELPG